MFSSGENTVAQKLINVINNFPDLQYKYGSLLERFALDAIDTKNKTNPRRNFKLKAVAEIDKPLAEDYHRMWKDLADPNLPKLAGTKPEDILDNTMISKFFAQLPMFAFLQSGMDASAFSMNGVMPTGDFKTNMDPITKAFTKQILNSKEANGFLDSFLNTFMTNNSTEINAKLKGRGISYDIGMRNLLSVEDLAKVGEGVDVPNLNKFIVEMNTRVAELNQSVEDSEELGERQQVVDEKAVKRFNEFVASKDGVKPEVYFTDADHKYMLNAKGLYNLVDKATGEVFARDFNLETGFYEAKFKDEATQPSTNVEKFSYARTSDNSYEVSTAGDSRFSALNAKLKDGRTIEEAYQLDVKGYRTYKPGEKVDARTAGEFTGEDKNGKEIILDASKATIVREDTQDPSSVYINIQGEEYSVSKREIIPINPTDKNWKKGKGKKPLHGYSEEDNYLFYKDLWSQWIKENPSLLEDLKQKAKGKVLTDKFASSPVSQARALADILNETIPSTQPSTETIDPTLAKQKASAVKYLKDSIKDYNLDAILAEKGYDIQDFINNLEASVTKEELTDNITKILEKLC